jgi:nucleoside diphosphate kinase
MITRSEKEYRAVQMDSSSSLKEFSVDRKKYHKKYILGEKVEDDENKAAVMGRVVETLLLEPELFESRFHMSTCEGAPTGLMNDFVEALYKRTLEATDVFGKVARSFEDISKDAYVDSGFKIKYEAVMNKFAGSEAETYYDEIRVVRAKGLTVVTANDMNNAERIVNELRNNFVTKDIVNQNKSARYDVYNQYQVEGFDVLGLQCKGMIDKIVVDHEAKTLQIYDLKCTWSVENFYEEYYLYRRAYIQAYVYWMAGKTIVKDLEIENYAVEFPRFIVCDSTSYMNPLIYTLDAENMTEAMQGFTHKGRNYPGIVQIIEDLEWAKETDTWNISKSRYESGGVVNIKQ